MSKNNILASKGAEQLNHALQSLKSSLDDLIDITNDLIPEQALQLGIPEYFLEICLAIEAEKKIAIDFTWQGKFREMNDDLRIKTYRIMNMLINIILVHATSTKTKIHSAYTNNVIKINGSYHRKIHKTEPEVVWDNMKLKVHVLNGNVDVQYLEDNVTAFTIDFAVQ
jgi:glucose-6-phosphate-specific signal transduction histidine kinase